MNSLPVTLCRAKCPYCGFVVAAVSPEARDAACRAHDAVYHPTETSPPPEPLEALTGRLAALAAGRDARRPVVSPPENPLDHSRESHADRRHVGALRRQGARGWYDAGPCPGAVHHPLCRRSHGR